MPKICCFLCLNVSVLLIRYEKFFKKTVLSQVQCVDIRDVQKKVFLVACITYNNTEINEK